MVVILVHWLVKRGIENTEAFENMWKQMTIRPNTGLYRELLTMPVQAEDPKFNTFSITGKNGGQSTNLDRLAAAVSSGSYDLPPSSYYGATGRINKHFTAQ